MVGLEAATRIRAYLALEVPNAATDTDVIGAQNALKPAQTATIEPARLNPQNQSAIEPAASATATTEPAALQPNRTKAHLTQNRLTIEPAPRLAFAT